MDNITTAADLIFSATLPTATHMDSIAAGALSRGLDRYSEGNYTAAIREFRRTIALSPYSDNALSAFEYLANAQIKNGKTSDAMQTYRQAIKVFSSADGMRLNLGNLLYSGGRYGEAVDQYKAAVRINPTLSQNIYSLGQGYLAQERYTEAEAQFKRAIQLAPKDSGGYYALGQTYRKMGRFTEAQQQLSKAISIKGNFTEAHFELGMVYAEQGKSDEANTELRILGNKGATLQYAELLAKINETSKPGFSAVYSPELNLSKPAGTKVSSLDSALAEAGAVKTFTVSFVFDKQMSATSVASIANWSISRSASSRTGGLYNWGMAVPGTEVNVRPLPTSVTYDSKSLTAKVTFSIKQNTSANGTIDLSHLVFRFKGRDTYGNTMNPAADEYNRLSRIV
ncbi:MAG TPA: hypothetical protein DCR97_10575 [Deltaproteobacteria bacterium]|nr:hypothetical protein [Deltaproteobacteria bacterium]